MEHDQYQQNSYVFDRANQRLKTITHASLWTSMRESGSKCSLVIRINFYSEGSRRIESRILLDCQEYGQYLQTGYSFDLANGPTL